MENKIDLYAMDEVCNKISTEYIEDLYYRITPEGDNYLELMREAKDKITVLHELEIIDDECVNELLKESKKVIIEGVKYVTELKIDYTITKKLDI